MTQKIDACRQLVVPGDAPTTIAWCTEHWIACANSAIQQRGRFAVALSGGSTPNAMYKALASPQHRERVDWSRVLLFWSDERAVPPDDPESNYHAAMEAGMDSLGIPHSQIFRMEAEGDTVAGARRYEDCLNKQLPGQPLDLVMLGMGDDGHVASLFPNTAGLNVHDHRVIANEIPQKACWRMTLTFKEINQARAIMCTVMGSAKAEMLATVLQKTSMNSSPLPAQSIGTESRPCLWIADAAAAARLQL